MQGGPREAFEIGQRCKVGECFATIRYVGPVPPSQGANQSTYSYVNSSVSAVKLPAPVYC